MTQTASSSNRLWAGVLAIAVLVAVVFVADPFDRDGSDPMLDGLNDAPFIAVLQRDEIPEVELDEVLEKLEANDSGAETGVISQGFEPGPDVEVTRGTRSAAD